MIFYASAQPAQYSGDLSRNMASSVSTKGVCVSVSTSLASSQPFIPATYRGFPLANCLEASETVNAFPNASGSRHRDITAKSIA